MTLLLSSAMLFSVTAVYGSQSSALGKTTSVALLDSAVQEEAGTDSEAAKTSEGEDKSAEAEALLKDLTGSYQELWPVAFDETYAQTWLDNCVALVGEEEAEEAVDTLKASVSGTVYGTEAEEKYKDSADMAFNCEFTQDVDKFTFDGSTISGTDEKGEEVFSYSYSYIGYDEGAGFYEFQSDDENAGEFTYMMLAGDTPAATYHIEFLYGSDLDALTEFRTGDYAYWMAAGIPENCDDAMAENAIKLFCTENLSGKN